MRVSAKADYAVRAAVELAAAGEGEPVKGERLATSQDIPLQFLEHILLELKHQGLVRARRGAKGGYWLARPADEVTVADVVRAVEGPIANVQSMPPETIEYAGNAESLRDVWIAVRANIRSVLEEVTLADLVSGELPQLGRGAHRRARLLGRPLARLRRAEAGSRPDPGEAEDHRQEHRQDDLREAMRKSARDSLRLRGEAVVHFLSSRSTFFSSRRSLLVPDDPHGAMEAPVARRTSGVTQDFESASLVLLLPVGTGTRSNSVPRRSSRVALRPVVVDAVGLFLHPRFEARSPRAARGRAARAGSGSRSRSRRRSSRRGRGSA